MFTATILAIFFVPMFFLLVKRLFKQDKAHAPTDHNRAVETDAPGPQRPQEA
jgi:HAE1 family hydrophobic/amphiphilic exporter-1/multidrug efflux pump